MARLLALVIAATTLVTSTTASAQYDLRQCARIIDQLTAYRQANAFKQLIRLARELASYCKDSSYDIALEALATGLNGDNQYGEALTVANRCLQTNVAEVQFACLADKADALYGLGRVQEAKAIIERALRQPAITEWDVKIKEHLRGFLAELNEPFDPAAYGTPLPNIPGSVPQAAPFLNSRTCPSKLTAACSPYPSR